MFEYEKKKYYYNISDLIIAAVDDWPECQTVRKHKQQREAVSRPKRCLTI